jgi:endonuclease/exonuclease/phosphatase family metal-dependent hydrolase
MKLVCWNIAGGHIFRETLEDAISYEEENLDYFIEKLRSENADVIVLQEAHTPINKEDLGQCEVIAQRLDYSFTANHTYGLSHIKSGNQLSLSTLSRYPIVHSVFHKLPNPGLSVIRPNGDSWASFDVGFLVCETDFNGTLINIANGHMVPFHYYKRDFSEPDFQNVRSAISELCVTLSEKPTLVGADFNYNDVSSLLPELFKDNTYREAFVDIETTPGRGQQDHMLYSKQWHFESCEVKKVEADHFLCSMEVALSS